MSSQESDTQFLTNAVNQMDQEEQEDDEFLAGALNDMDQEEEEEDEFLRNVPYVPPPSPPPAAAAAVPHLNDDDPLLLIPAGDPDEISSPEYDAPPSPKQVGEKPRSNFDYLNTMMTLITVWHTTRQERLLWMKTCQ